MSDYRCSTCGGYGITCTCYRHHPSGAEDAAWDISRIPRKLIEDTVSDWVRGFSYGLDENGQMKYPTEKIPVTFLDEDLLSDLKQQFLLGQKWERALSERCREEGKARHEARKNEYRQKKEDQAKRDLARQRALNRLIDEELTNLEN